jgi:phosphate transport system permease protein
VGATRWQTIRRIVLPNSVSGILTGVILQVSRTAGETAPIMFTGAVFFKKIPEGEPVRLQPARPVHGAVDAPVHRHHPGDRGAAALPTPSPVVLLGRC